MTADSIIWMEQKEIRKSAVWIKVSWFFYSDSALNFYKLKWDIWILVKKKGRQAQFPGSAFIYLLYISRSGAAARSPWLTNLWLLAVLILPCWARAESMTSEQIKVRRGGRRAREKPDTLFSSTPPASSASPNCPPYALPPRSPWVSLSLFWPPSPQWYPEAGVLLKKKEYSCSLVSLGSASTFNQHWTESFQNKKFQKDPKTAKLESAVC